MSGRERKLSLIVGGALGVAGLWWAGKSLYYRVITQHRDAIRAVQVDLNALETDKRKLKTTRDDWKKIVSRTLDYSPDKAHMRFREDMSNLLERHGFTHDQLTVRSLGQRRNKDGTVELPVQVTTKGKLKELVALMVDVARRDYLLRVENLTVTAEHTRSATEVAAAGRRGKNVPAAQPAGGDPKGPDLSISFTGVTLTVPQLKDVTAQPMKEIVEAEKGRLPRPPAEYDRIAAINVFSDYKAPPPPPEIPPQTVAEATTPAAQTTTAAEPPPPNPRADAAHMVVVGTTGHEGKERALIRDDRKATESAEPVALNSKIDDGVLVLVHPRGIVVHATAGAEAGKQFFYKLGAKFTERIPVENVQHKDVLRDLQIALGRPSG